MRDDNPDSRAAQAVCVPHGIVYSTDVSSQTTRDQTMHSVSRVRSDTTHKTLSAPSAHTDVIRHRRNSHRGRDARRIVRSRCLHLSRFRAACTCRSSYTTHVEKGAVEAHPFPLCSHQTAGESLTWRVVLTEILPAQERVLWRFLVHCPGPSKFRSWLAAKQLLMQILQRRR